MRARSQIYTEEMERLRKLNAYKDKIPGTLEWLLGEAAHQLEGLKHAVQGRASKAIVLKEAADVGNLCQLIME